jgi:hypothetical protein
MPKFCYNQMSELRRFGDKLESSYRRHPVPGKQRCQVTAASSYASIKQPGADRQMPAPHPTPMTIVMSLGMFPDCNIFVICLFHRNEKRCARFVDGEIAPKPNLHKK